MCALAALRVWRRQVQGFCTVECAVWVAGAWLGLSRGCFSPDGDWVLCLGVWFGVSSQHQWWLLVCGVGGDVGCGAGMVGAPGAPLWHVGASFWYLCALVCAVLGGCRRGVTGCFVLCFLFCAATYRMHAL